MVAIKSLFAAVALVATSVAALPSAEVSPVDKGELAQKARLGYEMSTYYHVDCTGSIYNNNVKVGLDDDGLCINTDCDVGSFDIHDVGGCPDGEVQISYWERPGCKGRWYGYGYTSRNTCHRAFTDGYKFQAVHLRCASQAKDCVSQVTCSYDGEPARGLCQI